MVFSRKKHVGLRKKEMKGGEKTRARKNKHGRGPFAVRGLGGLMGIWTGARGRRVFPSGRTGGVPNPLITPGHLDGPLPGCKKNDHNRTTGSLPNRPYPG